jgi:hypothetical protein
MQPFRDSVAMSLNSYIAGPQHNYEWIVTDGAALPTYVYSRILPEGKLGAVAVAVIPVLLGGGLPLSAPDPQPTLRGQRLYPKTGTVFLNDDVQH